MIADLKPYPAMKDSGVEWLGEVPEHWEMERGKWLFRKMDRPIRDADEVVTCFRDGIVTLRKNRRVSGFTESLKEIGYQGIRRGDLVIHGMDAFAGAIGVADSDGKGTPVYSVCEPGPSANARYYAYALREMARSQWIQALAKGIRERSTDFRFKSFSSQPVPFPPLAEQAAIVRFLDHADRRIQRYIRAKQKLITLLQEQKQALIHQAVTGQIDVRTGQPYPAYKPSGVQWLGEVPEHWEVIRFGKLITLTTGFPFKSEGFTQSEEDVRLLRGVNIAPGRLRWEEVVRWSAVDTDNFAEYQLELGDIVLGMDRPIIQDGIRVAVVEQSDMPSLLLQRVARIRASEELERDFALLLLSGKSFSDYLAPIFTGISVPHLSPEQIRGFRLALPSLAEQEKILEQLRPSIGSIRSAMNRALSQILLLREYHTRLIADVVTGKLDVREAASRLPDEVEEPEPLDDAEAFINGEEEPSDDLTAPEKAAV